MNKYLIDNCDQLRPTCFYIRHMDMAIVKAECGTWLLIDRKCKLFEKFQSLEEAVNYCEKEFA